MVARRPQSRSWPYFRTPLTIFLATMGPINGLMVALIIGNTTTWMRITAAVVVTITAFATYKGYVRRLHISPIGARMTRLTGSTEIPWSEIGMLGTYAPGGGGGGIEYVYITRRDTPPAGKWDIDADTIQIQNREGLMETILEMQRAAAPREQVNS